MYIGADMKKLFRGSLETIILELLDRNYEMYGYQIVKEVQTLSEGNINITEGALYPALHKLEKNKHITSNIKSFNNRKRKYYSLTPSGKEETARQLDDMKAFLQHLNLIFNPQLT